MKLSKNQFFDRGRMQPAAAHALRSHVCGLSSIFSTAHVAGKNHWISFRRSGGETLRGFWDKMQPGPATGRRLLFGFSARFARTKFFSAQITKSLFKKVRSVRRFHR
ncbi:MAG: hypothetical protein HPZ79_08230 [Oscillospiraceae bacterium]|nr:hypothetical protein [Oscillospiraceae bacterium]